MRLKAGWIIRIVCLVLIMGLSAAPAEANIKQNAHQKKLAIIIDDFGNNMNGTKEILSLPYPITVAVMPFLPSTKQDAELAYKTGHEILVHLPMEPFRGKKSWLGPGAITTDLSDEEIKKRVNAAIDNVPHAIGVNNHMGSKATSDPRVMRIVLQVCHERGLIFLDSKTTHKSVIPKIAGELHVPYVENHIFLDDDYKIPHILKQCRLIQKHLKDHDICIAIGHVGPPGKKTATVLKKELPELSKTADLLKVSQITQAAHSQLPDL